ncbi:hypothetical protein IU402_04650 [Aerococcaceae bacterium zg-BR9]|uniref:hypothetical protein n=1 Tax=Aerococcaceae bacterium zg-1292 TaxID=2774330 RepID=UPI00406484A7|nr:hypothetical protein [Aerococcaceae bacterium zg-BR9]
MKRKYLLLLLVTVLLLGCTSSLEKKKVDIGLEEKDDIQLVENKSIPLEKTSDINDIVVNKQFIFLSDSQNKLVHLLNKDNYKIIKTLSAKSFNMDLFTPSGLFATDDMLYMLDNVHKQIIQYNLNDDTHKIIQLSKLDTIMLNTFMSITIVNKKIFLSLSANKNEANCIYEVEENGQLKKVVKGFIGYLNTVDNSLVATNAYYHKQDKEGTHITTGDSRVMLVNDKNQVTAYQLDSKVAPYKMYQLGNFMITSSLGTASIIKYDIKNNTSKVIYSMKHTGVEDAQIGMLAVDKDNTVYLIDNSNHKLMKLVYSDAKYLDEY